MVYTMPPFAHSPVLFLVSTSGIGCVIGLTFGSAQTVYRVGLIAFRAPYISVHYIFGNLRFLRNHSYSHMNPLHASSSPPLPIKTRENKQSHSLVVHVYLTVFRHIRDSMSKECVPRNSRKSPRELRKWKWVNDVEKNMGTFCHYGNDWVLPVPVSILSHKYRFSRRISL